MIATEVGYRCDPTPSPLGLNHSPELTSSAPPSTPGRSQYRDRRIESRTNYLLYFMANQRIYRPEAGSDRGLDVNFAFDWTPGQFTNNYSQVTGGFRYHGLIPHRERDTVSVGVVYSRISPTLNQAYADAGLLPFGSEKAVEVNYALKVTRWFTFQPVVQYYFDTGANPLAHNSLVAGFRTSIHPLRIKP